MTDRITPDPMDVLTRYAPTTATLARDWDQLRPDDAVQRIVSGELDDQPVRLVPRRPVAHRRKVGARLPVLVSAGVFGVAAATLAAVLVGSLDSGNGGGNPSTASGSGYDPAAGGRPYTPPGGLSNTALGAKQYSYRVVEQLNLDRAGAVIAHSPDAMVDRSYVSATGQVISLRTGLRPGCYTLDYQGPNFGEPNVAFFAKLPTDVPALTTYLRRHVQGSSSRDEAVFVAVGDMLRTADGLASPKLRAALVAVLSRTPGVYLHRGARDDAGRPALRLDFVNQRIRPGEVQSLYFDPNDFRLLEDRDGSNGARTSGAIPDPKSSPAYNAPAPADGKDPQTLSGPAFVSIMRTERVVDHLPKLPANCQH